MAMTRMRLESLASSPSSAPEEGQRDAHESTALDPDAEQSLSGAFVPHAFVTLLAKLHLFPIPKPSRL